MTLTPRLLLACLALAGCAPVGLGNPWQIVPPDAAVDVAPVVDAPVVADAPADRAEVLRVDAPSADVVVLDTGDAVVVWITDRPTVDVPAVDAPEAPAPTDAPTDTPQADAGAPVDAGVDVPPVDVPAPCGVLQERCGGVCASLLTDPAHCGACGRVCPGGAHATGVCNGGRCEVACAEGYADCGRGCQSTVDDRANCGGCGFVCGVRETCVAGNCAGCATGESVCGGACVRLDTAEHCGACTHRCPLGAACVRGTTCEYTSCAAGRDAGTWTLCPDGCVDVRGDDGNCLGCGSACPAGTHCLGGVCG